MSGSFHNPAYSPIDGTHAEIMGSVVTKFAAKSTLDYSTPLKSRPQR